MMVNRHEAGRPSERAKGVACVSARDFRWEKAHIKSTSLLGAVLARQMQRRRGAAETIMFRDGCLTEASASQRLGGARTARCSARRRANLCSKASATG